MSVKSIDVIVLQDLPLLSRAIYDHSMLLMFSGGFIDFFFSFRFLFQAAEISNETGDKSACYHLARHFESQVSLQADYMS